jgi:excinuclease ABC subunit C
MKTDQLELLPLKSGVYKFYDKNNKILYIGKALNLRNRVKSYFNDTLYDRPYVKKMIPYIENIEVVETNNEIESLVLESALIKELKPKYNTELKDDKSYAWIYVSTKDKFPTVKISRNITNKELKKGELFGPYPNKTLPVLYLFTRESTKRKRVYVLSHRSLSWTIPRTYLGERI